jgi:glycerol-3-phosphate dehydrogenase
MVQLPALGDTSRAAGLRRLADETFDVLVIGGGIGAACAAWDAALRGLRVALVERLDFGAGASAHSLKMLHGGIRYLQHLDMQRLRESCRERGTLLRIAPHLTRPLPIAVPTYGYGIQSRWLFGVALAVLETLTFDRNLATADRERHVPRSFLLSRAEVLRRFPALENPRLTGAGVFFDGQIVNPTRAVLAVVRAAAEAGAAVANYCEARELVMRDGRVAAVQVRDLLRDEPFEIRARVTINATGPFAPALSRQLGRDIRLDVPLSRDMAFVIRRVFDPAMAVAVQTLYRDPDAVLSRGNRHLFMAPWRNRYTLVGVNSRVYTDSPYQLQVTEEEIAGFLSEINQACPSLAVRREDVTLVNAGLLPFGDNEPERKDLSFGKRSQVVDHARAGGPEGLVSAMSVRWTMGRLTGEQAVDMAVAKLGAAAGPSVTANTPVWGGDIESVERARAGLRQHLPAAISDAQVARLFCHYGSKAAAVVPEDAGHGACVAGTDCLEAEVRYAVRSELAATLADVVMRRLDLGTAECPAAATLADCARIVGDELGWDEARRMREVCGVQASYPFANPRSQLPEAAA